MGNPLSTPDPHGPTMEEMLEESLNPYTLKDAKRYAQSMEQMLNKHKAGDDPKQLLRNNVNTIEDISEFCSKLGKLATKEERSEWYRKTYIASKTGRAMAGGHVQTRHHSPQSPSCQSSGQASAAAASIESENLRLHNVNFQHEHVIEQQKKRIKEQDEQLQKLERHNAELQRQVKDITERLAEEMNAKISKNEEAIENIALKNRPMTIATEYSAFISNVWLEAKDSLDGAKVEPPTAIKMLVEILEVAEQEAKRRHEEFQTAIYNVFIKQSENAPAVVFDDVDLKRRVDTMRARKIPDGLKNSIRDFLRITADRADITVIVDVLTQHLQLPVDTIVRKSLGVKGGQEKKSFKVLRLDKYLQESAKLAWKMVIQSPVMTFETKIGVGQKWKDGSGTDLFWGSDDPSQPGSVVQFYVHPTLKHGQNIMVKGKVFVGNAQKLST